MEYGTTPTAYEPYKEQAITLQTPNGLLGLKVNSGGNYTDSNGQQWICNEIDLACGKYVQRVRKGKVPHDVYWNIQTQEGYKLAYNNLFKGGVKTQNEETTWMSNFGDSSATWKNGFCYGKSDVFWIVPYKNSGEITSEDVNNWLKEHPMEVVYPLKTPIETDLPPETIAAFRKLHMNYPNTIVSNNAGAGMELTYTVDTQSYVDSKIAEINMQVVNTQKQLLQERSK